MTTRISSKNKRRRIHNYCKKIRNCRKLRYNYLKLRMSIKPGSSHCKWINYTRNNLYLLGVVKERAAKFLERVCLEALNM